MAVNCEMVRKLDGAWQWGINHGCWTYYDCKYSDRNKIWKCRIVFGPISSEKLVSWWCPSHCLAKCTQVQGGGAGHPDLLFMWAPKMNLGCHDELRCKNCSGRQLLGMERQKHCLAQKRLRWALDKLHRNIGLFVQTVAWPKTRVKHGQNGCKTFIYAPNNWPHPHKGGGETMVACIMLFIKCCCHKSQGIGNFVGAK